MIGGVAVGMTVGLAVSAVGRLARRVGSKVGDDSAALRSEFTVIGALVGGGLGGASHSVLDGMMHSDVRPFLPFSEGNWLLGVIGTGNLHLACVLAGFLGIAAMMLVRARRAPGRLP